MAKLTSKQRKHMPKSEFAGPHRSFPIPDASHARNALARVADKPEAEKEKVRAAVHRKFPSIGEGRDKTAKKTVKRSRKRA